MKFKGLSARLKKAYELALPGLDFWDVGCDHGQLGIYALHSKQFSRIFFVDPALHQIQFLKTRTFSAHAHFFPVSVQNVTEKIEGNFIFLGVGGTTIKNALLGLNQLHAQRLILGPQKDLNEIESLSLGNYQLVEKYEVLERGRTRQLYIFDRTSTTSVS